MEEAFSKAFATGQTLPVVMGNQGGGVNSGRPYITGGKYSLELSDVTGAGTVELQKQGPGGSFISLVQPFNNAGTEADLIVGKLAAVGQKTLDIPPGVYQIVTAGFTAGTVALTRVPNV